MAAEGPFLRFYRAKDFEYVASRRVFKAQSVHGISVYAEEHNQSHVTKLVVWGGRLVRALEVISSGLDFGDLDVHLSVVARAPDWILDLTPRPIDLEDEAVYHAGTCVAVTAHNALLQVDIERGENRSSSFEVHVKELTSSSRSILYSAHVFFESQQCILIAAGTAFGEIIFWSASYSTEDKFVSQIHRVFLGHEGSIFGVRISKELPSDCCQKLKRVIASCSDDRTIRIWDVSEIDFTGAQLIQETHSSQREHHTGFSNEAFDTTPSSSSACLAIGWGHSSRVWKVHFLDSMPCDGSLVLLSAGEDATLRTWRMKPSIEQKSSFQYTLHEKDCAAYHSGKNIWSFAVQSASRQQQHVVCGAADAKITASTLRIRTAPYEPSPAFKVHEYTVTDMLSRLPGNLSPDGVGSCDKQKSSKKTEFFRSYCALSQGNFLLTTNLGRVLAISLDQTGSIDTAELIEKRDDLSGYSLCASDRTGDYAFVAGAGGAIYTYSSDTRTITEVTMVEGKVGDLFVSKPAAFVNRKYVVLLTTLMGQKRAELHYLRTDSGQGFSIGPRIMVPVSEASTGSVVTSMAHVAGSELDFLILGFRRGSIALYSISNDSSNSVEAATMFRVIEGVHGEETVTALYWISTPETGSTGHLLSVGRDGQLAIHAINLLGNSVVLVHDLTLPFGPNVEGIYSHGADILVHGFSNKKWVLYNIKTEEEIMAVETGGGHRSWAFQQNPGSVGGTLIWTRASSMHIYSRTLPSHEVVRAGGHGREIKAVAISPNKTRPLIATGSEDTDIKIFEYVEGDLRCRKTLRKHTTGIQHLQWSHDGNYLFSSGGCEELYVWRIRHLPAFMDIGVVCEHAYISESEYADLRIMSFDAKELDASYIISVVFSDSSLKVGQCQIR